MNNLEVISSTEEFLVFKTQEKEKGISVRYENDNLWMTQKAMAELFDTGIDNINVHLKNIFEENELDMNSTIEEISIVQTEGNRKVNRKVKFYSLDAIISVKTDKGKAIEKVLKMENIADNDVYAIGDGVNDVEMILKYNGYGMKNSSQVIYKVTNKLCNTVSELIENIK